ncbi:MAG: 4Fe-4S binding protein [Candidatus Thorarchaeota archaeon]
MIQKVSRINNSKSTLLLYGLIAFTVILVAYPLIARAQMAAPTDREVTIVAHQFEFNPSIIRVNVGDNVTIHLRVADVPHGLYIDGYELNVHFIPLDDGPNEETLNFIADKPGVFRYRCSVPCGNFHPFMVGKLVVEPAYEFPIASILAILFSAGMVGFMWRSKPSTPKPPKRINILGNSLVRRLLRSRYFQFTAMFISSIFFLLVILTGLFGTPVGNENFSIIVVWIIWWGALMLFLVPFGGRLWCTICPLPSYGEWAQRGALTQKSESRHGLLRKWPKRLNNIWLQNFGFLSMSMFIGVFITIPMATAWLMILLIAMPLVLSLVFKDRVFCRYLCPVSGFIGLYSMAGALELRVKDRQVCREHIENDCIRGNERGYPCPWFEFPQNLDRNAYCGLCTECIKTCPKDNVAVNIRFGGEDLEIEPWGGRKKRGLDEPWKAFIMLTLSFLYGLVFMGPYGWLKNMAGMKTVGEWVIFAGLVWGTTLLVTPAIFYAFAAISKRVSGATEISRRDVFKSYSYALVPLGLLAWIAFSVAIVLINGSYFISVLSDPFGWGWDLFGTTSYPWTPYFSLFVPYAQIVLLLLGLVLAIRTTYKISMRLYPNRQSARRGSIPIIIFFILFTMLLLWLWVGW